MAQRESQSAAVEAKVVCIRLVDEGDKAEIFGLIFCFFFVFCLLVRKEFLFEFAVMLLFLL